ncbi:hypothetical protein BES08_16110 [Novosphingobium resinovorum]|uniref:Nucleotidyltransferase family protein n=1 Tax=Novosphingobium resinovorum TaxID=158500 RepID=A0A1D8A7L4_9SPHN|nr:hypothetical protein BES08_16110 [Novosphingobium resinovorum]
MAPGTARDLGGLRGVTVRSLLRAEFTFLLLATTWPHDAAAIAAIRAAAKDVTDTDLLMALSRRHHVTGLVARAVGHCHRFAGSRLRRDLQAEAMALAEEQFRQLMQTHHAVAALRAQDISVAVLKGVPAALAVYGEVGVRRSVDIDLLVGRDHVDRARVVLEQIGYARSAPPPGATAHELQGSRRYGKDWGFDHFHSDTGIELHWRLFQNPRLLGCVDAGDAQARTVAPGLSLPVLPPHVTALYLVLHGAEHAWSRLKWLADLAALLRQDTHMPGRIAAAAAAQGLAQPAMAALLLSRELYGTPMPEETAMPGWRARALHAVARASLLGAQDGAELEDCATATTRKNLSHYLFSRDPRFWWHELAYDLFHDADGRGLRHVAQRTLNVLRLPAAAKVSPR